MSFNIEDIVDKIVASNYDVSIFNQVDDSDLTLAPNVLEFVMSDRYLNQTPYPRQAQILLHLFEDICWDCSDPKLSHNMHRETLAEIQDRVQLFNYGVCPKCNKNRQDYRKEGLCSYPHELDACIGQRSGKSILTAMGVNYLHHWMTKIPSPSRYYNLIANQTLHFTMTALTFEQASETLYQPFIDMHQESPWFKQYYEMLTYHGEKRGEELFKVNDTFVWDAVKRLMLYPKGPDKRKMRGRTRYGYAIDEIGWFDGDSDSVKMSADDIDDALNASCITLRTKANYKIYELEEIHVPTAMGFCISSPSHANDKIMRLVRDGRDNPNKRVFHYATWEAHPEITRKSLEPDFRKDPIAAERNLGANPPIANSPFLGNQDAVSNVFRGKLNTDFATLIPRMGKDSSNRTYVYAELKVHVSDKTRPFVLTVDAGLNNNNFAVVLSHWENDVIYHDLCLEVVPLEDTYINHSYLYDFVLAPLFKNFNIALFAADRWNSIKILQDAEKTYNTQVEQHSLMWKDFNKYKDHIYSERVVAPRTEEKIDVLLNPRDAYSKITKDKPALHFALQMLTVKEVGKKVDKGDGGLTDDIWRAASLASHFLLDDNDTYKLRVMSGGNAVRKRGLGSVRTKTGNSGGGVMSNRMGIVRTKGGGR